MAALRPLRVEGTVRPPGDKSISHRALILAALAAGTSRVDRVLDSADTRSTAQALRQLGAEIPALGPQLAISGRARALQSSRAPIDCGNSGTTARLLAGVVAGAGITGTFAGDASLSRRPMRRIADPLRAMGAQVELGDAGGLPMTVRGGSLRPVEWASPVASAQVKSAILLAAVLGGVRARVAEPVRSRDHTEVMLEARGVRLIRERLAVEVHAGQEIAATDMTVPADPSSAAFFAAVALLAGRGELRIEDVCLNPTRVGFVAIFRRMGGSIAVEAVRDEAGEQVGTLVVRPSPLRGTVVAPEEVPSSIDELPVIACAAACAAGETTIAGAAELRVKESDRVATLVKNLRAIGADAAELPDGLVVAGHDRPLAGTVRTEGDHRIAMAFGVLAALPGNDITIDDPDCAVVSYPAFWDDLRRVAT